MRSAPEGWMDAERKFHTRNQGKRNKENAMRNVKFIDVVLFCCITSSLFYFML